MMIRSARATCLVASFISKGEEVEEVEEGVGLSKSLFKVNLASIKVTIPSKYKRDSKEESSQKREAIGPGSASPVVSLKKEIP